MLKDPYYSSYDLSTLDFSLFTNRFCRLFAGLQIKTPVFFQRKNVFSKLLLPNGYFFFS